MARPITGNTAGVLRMSGPAWTCGCTGVALAYAVAVQPSWPPSPLACSGLVGLSLALVLTLGRLSAARHEREATIGGA